MRADVLGHIMRALHLAVSAMLIVCGIVLPTALGVLWADYDPASSFLSELGARDAPYAAVMNYAGFLPVGALWALAAALLYARAPKSALSGAGALLLLGNAVSYVGASVFPCDAGCPLQGSDTQAMHNLLGVIGYLATPPALVFLGIAFFRSNRLLSLLTLLVAAVCTAGFVMMAAPEAAPVRGFAQRSVDFTQFAWMFAAALLVRSRKTP